MKDLKAKYDEYMKLKSESDRLLDECEERPDDENLDMQSDKAYEQMWAALEEFAEAVHEFTAGAVDAMTAKRMAVNFKYRDRLRAIMSLMA